MKTSLLFCLAVLALPGILRAGESAAVPAEDIAFFETTYQTKIEGVTGLQHWSDPNQFYQAIAQKLGIPNLAKESTWKDDKVECEMTIQRVPGNWRILLTRPGPTSSESKAITINDAKEVTIADPDAPWVDALKNRKPVIDPVATGKWLNSLFSIRDGELAIKAVHSKDPEDQVPLVAEATVALVGKNGISIDQEGLLPVEIWNSDWGDGKAMATTISMNSGFYRPTAILDLDNYQLHPKFIASSDGSIFRIIGELLHAHFTRLAEGKPEHYRVEDVLGYPSDHYLWAIGQTTVYLRAHHGNDNDGLLLKTLRADRESGRTEIARIRALLSAAKSSTQASIFKGWNEPLPAK